MLQNIIDDFKVFLIIIISLLIILFTYTGLIGFSNSTYANNFNGFEHPELNWNNYFETGMIKVELIEKNGETFYKLIKIPSQEIFSNSNDVNLKVNSFTSLITFLNPFYWVSLLIKSDTFVTHNINFYIDGVEGIDPTILVKETGVNIFSLKDFNWTIIMLSPYIYCLVFGGLGLYIKKIKEDINKDKRKNYAFNHLILGCIFISLISSWTLMNYDNSNPLEIENYALSNYKGIYFWNSIFNYNNITDANYINTIDIMKANGINTHVNIFNYQSNLNKLQNLFDNGTLNINTKLLATTLDSDIIMNNLFNSLQYLQISKTMLIIAISLIIFFIVKIIAYDFIIKRN